MQSPLVTCVSEKGWPSRDTHACDREGTMEELGRGQEATSSSMRMAAGAPSQSTAPKGHREYGESTQSLAQKGATVSAGAGAGTAKPTAAPQARPLTGGDAEPAHRYVPRVPPSHRDAGWG